MTDRSKSRLMLGLLTATALSTAGSALAQTLPVVSSDAQTQVYTGANGATVVNIATPNGAGVSHNHYDQFNVPKAGVVLNNGGLDQQTRTSQLAGAVTGNANITGAQATVILNEVTKANPSMLTGYTEILGGKADLVLANPWGITCDGCGFINTARLTLGTGAPQFAANGALAALRTTDGLLTITGAGLDATAADTLALVARSIKVDGQINAKTIDAVAGATRYDVNSGEVTVVAAARPAAQYAIDASALGSMYAGRIRLIATDAGVGVRALGRMGASAGDLTLTADGQIVLGGQASASGAVVATSVNGGITSDHAQVSAGTDLALNAQHGALTLTGGRLYAARDLTATAASLSDSLGSIPNVDLNRRDAGRNANVTITGDARLTDVIWSGQAVGLAAAATAVTGGGIATDDLKLRTASLALDRATLTSKRIDVATTGTLSLTNTAAIISQNTTALNAGQLINAGRITGGSDAMTLTGQLTNSGLIEGYGPVTIGTGRAALDNSGIIRANALTVTAGALGNRGTIEAQIATLTAASIDNAAAATIRSGGTLGIVGDNGITNRGTIVTAGSLTTRTAGALVTSGTIASDGALSLRAATLSVETGGVARGNGGVDAAITGDTMVAGVLIGDRSLTLTGGGKLAISDAGAVASRGAATIDVAGPLSLTAQAVFQADSAALKSASLSNAGRLTTAGALTVDTRRGALANTGTMSAGGAVALTTGVLTNAGLLSAVGTLVSDTGGQTVTNSGQLLAGGDARLTAGALDNSGTFYTGGVLNAALTGAAVNRGTVQAVGGSILSATTLDNRGGFYAATAAGADATIRVGALTNAAGATLASGDDLSLTVAGAFNNAGLLAADGNLGLGGGLTSFANTGGIQASKAATIDASGIAVTIGARGQLLANTLDLKGASLANDGTVQANNAVIALAQDAANRGLINAQGTLRLSAATITNPGTLQAGGGLNATFTRLDNSGTLIASGSAGVAGNLSGADLVNTGTLASSGALGVTTTNSLSTTGTLYAAQALTIAANGATTLDGLIRNDAGLLKLTTNSATIAATGLKLYGDQVAITAPAFTNRGTIVAARDLTIDGATNITSIGTGVLVAGGAATLTASNQITNDGRFQSGGTATLNAAMVNNRGTLIGGTTAGAGLFINADTLSTFTNSMTQSGGTITLNLGQSLDNLGRIIAGQNLNLAQRAGVAMPLKISSGGTSVLQAAGTLNVNAANSDLTIANGALWYGGTDARIAARSLTVNGTIYSAGTGTVTIGQGLVNRGTLAIDGSARIDLGTLTNSGVVQAGSLQLTAGSIDNNGGTLLAGTNSTSNSTITTGSYVNTTPRPDAAGHNTSGVRSSGNLTMTVNGALTNASLITATGDLRLTGAGLTIDNAPKTAQQEAGLIQAGGVLTIAGPGVTFSRQAGDLFGQSINLNLATLDNAGRIVALGGGGTIDIANVFTNLTGGLVYFGPATPGAYTLLRVGTFVNSGTLQVDHRLTVLGRGFLNGIGANIVGGGALDLRLAVNLNDLQFANAGTINMAGDLFVNIYQPTDPLDGSSTSPNDLAFINTVNDGSILAGSTQIRGNLQNTGAILALGKVGVTGDVVANIGVGSRIAGHLGGANPSDLSDGVAARILTNQGSIGSLGNLAITAGTLTNAVTGGIGAIGTITVFGNVAGFGGGEYTNFGAIFGGNLDLSGNNFTNKLGGSVEFSGNAAFRLSDTLLNNASIVGGTKLSIAANKIRNELAPGFGVVLNDAPPFFDPLWNGTPGAAHSLYDRGDLYDEGRLRQHEGTGSNPNGSPISRPGNGFEYYNNVYTDEAIDNPDQYTDTYTQTFDITERFANKAAAENAKPQLISNGDLTLSGFSNVNNMAGVISASNALTLTGKDASATLNNTSINADHIFYGATWKDREDSDADDGYREFVDYQLFINSRTSVDSIGASINAKYIYGTNFGLVQGGVTANGAVTNTYVPPNAAGQQSIPITIQSTLPPPGSTTMAAPAADMVATASAPTVGVMTGGSVTLTPTAAATAAMPPAVDSILKGNAANGAVIAANLTAGIGGSLSGPPAISFGTTVVNLPTSPNGLFITSANPNSSYLVETNPLFLNQDAIGTGLLAKLLGLNPDGLIRRLGDAQYEDYLIKQQLVGQIGVNLIARGLTQGQQTEALIRSGANQATTLGLIYGQALTAGQQASLKSDMIWMVATKVNGQEVLAPVVYLSAATRSAFDKGDATVAANYANLALTSLVNNGGTIKADVLVVDAKNNIDNISGRIKGGVVALSAGGTITNATYVQYGGTDSVGKTQIGAIGSINATQALALDAKGDIKNLGANIFSGGSAALVAGGSIVIDTIVDKRASLTSNSGEKSTTNIGSNVMIAGDLFAQTKTGDIVLGGSTLGVGGLAMIDAAGKLDIVSRADTKETTKRETGGNLVQRTTTDTTEASTKSVGATLAAGDLYAKSGGDTNIKGSTVVVMGAGSFDVGGTMNVLADTNTTKTTTRTTETGLGVGDALFGARDKTVTDESGRNVASTVMIGGQGIVTAKGDVNLVGSTMHGQNLQVVGENVRILDGKNYDLHTEKESLTTVLGVSAGGSVGGSAEVQAGAYAGDHSVGGGASASGKVGAQAGDGKAPTTSVASEAKTGTGYDPRKALNGEEQDTYGEEDDNVAKAGKLPAKLGAAEATESSGGKMDRAQTGNNSVGFAAQGELKGEVNGNVGLALAQRRDSSSSSYKSSSVASELSADNNLTVVANKDLEVRGSKIAAGKDALLAANNIYVTSGQNVERTSSDSMTTTVGPMVNSKNDTTVSAEAKGSVGTTGTTNYDKTRNPTSSGGGVGVGGNLGQTGGSVGVSAGIDGSSRNDIDMARNVQTSSSSEKVTNVGSSISADGTLTMIAKDQMKIVGSDLAGKEGVGLKAKDMAFLAAQDTTSSSSSNRTTAVGYYAQALGNAGAKADAGADTQSKGAKAGASASAGAEAGVGSQVRNEMGFASSDTSTARTSSISSANGNVVRIADNKITDQGTQIDAKGDLLQTAKTWESKAATNSYSSSASAFVDQVRQGAYADAGAGAGSDASGQSGAVKQQGSASASATGGASVGVQVSAFHADDQQAKSGTTAVVSNITTGGKVVSITSDKTSLEGTNFKTGGDLTIGAGSLDWTAARDTTSNSALANTAAGKVQVGVDAEKLASGYGEVGYKGSGDKGQDTTAKVGSADVGGKLTIVSQGTTNLEGTKLTSGSDATIYSKGTLTYGAATDTKADLNNAQSAAGSISFAGKRGENVAAQVGVAVGSTDEKNATAGSVTSGGKLLIVSDKDASFAGTKLSGTGDTAVVAAGNLLLGTADSTKDNYSGQLGLGVSASRAAETAGTGQATAAPAAGAAATGTKPAAPAAGGTTQPAASSWVSAKPTATSGGTGTTGTTGAGTATTTATSTATAAGTGAGTGASTTTTAPATGSTASNLADGLRTRSQEDQQIGTKANIGFEMEKSTTRDASSVSSTNGNVVLKSGGNMDLQGTKISAGQTAVLDAGQNLNFGTANSDKLTVSTGLDLLGNRGSPGGVGTRVTDTTGQVSTEGKGSANAQANGAAQNTNAITTTAGAKEDTKLSGGVEAKAAFGYSTTQGAGSIDAKNIVTRSGGDTTFVGTNLDATKNIDIGSAGNVTFATAKSVSADASIGLSASGSTNPGPIGGKTALPAAAGGTGTPAPAANATGTGTGGSGAGSGVTIGTNRGTTGTTGAGTTGTGTTGTGTTGTTVVGQGAAAATPPKQDRGTEGQAGVTDIGVGVGVTNQYSTVNAGGALTINAGGRVAMDGTTGNVGSSAINAVGGVDRSTAVSAGAEIGMTRAGAFLDVQKADLGKNGTTVTGDAARAPVQTALNVANPLVTNAAVGVPTTAPAGGVQLEAAPPSLAPAPTALVTPSTIRSTTTAPLASSPLAVSPISSAPMPAALPLMTATPAVALPGAPVAAPAIVSAPAQAVAPPTLLVPAAAPAPIVTLAPAVSGAAVPLPAAQPVTAPIQPSLPAATFVTSVPTTSIPGAPAAPTPAPTGPALAPPSGNPVTTVPPTAPRAPATATPAPVGPALTPPSGNLITTVPPTTAGAPPVVNTVPTAPVGATPTPLSTAPAAIPVSGTPPVVGAPIGGTNPPGAVTMTPAVPIGSPTATTASITPGMVGTPPAGSLPLPTPATLSPTPVAATVDPRPAPVVGNPPASPPAPTPGGAALTPYTSPSVPAVAQRVPAAPVADAASPAQPISVQTPVAPQAAPPTGIVARPGVDASATPSPTGLPPAVTAATVTATDPTRSPVTIAATGGTPQLPILATPRTITYVDPTKVASAAERSLDQGGEQRKEQMVPIPLPSQLARWTVKDGVIGTRVDVSRMPTDRRARLLLPNGDWAPAWLTFDPRTGVVSGVVPAQAGPAGVYLSSIKVR